LVSSNFHFFLMLKYDKVNIVAYVPEQNSDWTLQSMLSCI
jgi:hypothetical protein